MIKAITSVKLKDKRVVVRAGFDVPLKCNIHTELFQVVDDTRIRDILPTLKYLIKQKAKIIIISHLGRPNGWEVDKSMWPVAEKLAELLNYKPVKVKNILPNYAVPHVYFLESDITKDDYSKFTREIRPGEILFLENIRFYQGDQENSPKFAKTLSTFGEVFVNDAFSVTHRKEASTYGIAKLLPSYAGVSLLAEIQSLNKVLHHPAQPMVVILGGAKVADKADTIHSLAKHAQYILVGGAMGNSFLNAAGYETGKSKVSDVGLAKELLRNYKDKIILPIDAVVAKSETDSKPRAVGIAKIQPNEVMFDVGPQTLRKFARFIKEAKTLVWNGPVGLIERRQFAHGSIALAQIFASKSRGKAFGVVGGGETLETMNMAKVSQFIDHISTGGGAMLEFLANKKLPGIEILKK